MEKKLCWASMGVAGVLFILFLVDLILGIQGTPFLVGKVSKAVDVVAMICCVVVGYLAWDALQDLR